MTAAICGRPSLPAAVGVLVALLTITASMATAVQTRGSILAVAEVRTWWVGVASALIASLLATGLTVFWVAKPLRSLTTDAKAIRAFRFDKTARRSWLREIDALGLAQREMSETVRQFLEISARLAADHRFSSLLDSAVREVLAASKLRAAALYLRQADSGLTPAAWLDAEGRDGLPAPRDLPPALAEDHPLLPPVRSRRIARDTLLPTVPPEGMEWLTAWFPGRSVNVLTVPLLNRPGEIVGVLCLASPDEDGSFPDELEAFVGALSGVIAVTVDQQHLMDERVRLFDALVRVVASAIDARSPHTGAHCQRVPRLAEMLAEAAAGAGMIDLDDDARESLRLAAWLHDCGKIALPDFVVDKPTKLAAFHDRIHEIRMRFEVLKRDAEIAYWQDRCAGGDEAARRARLEREWQVLDADFAFVAACNQGAEAMTDDTARRLEAIGERVWSRTIDDRLGIGHEELERKTRVPPRSLPAPEHVLADRLEHLIDWVHEEPLSKGAAQTRRKPPRHKLNLGERYNLAVAGGTLTPEERYLVDAHAGLTLAMLRELPWPRRLRGVPDIAGAHHERIDGGGHPRGLVGDQINPLARILAIADVFEALSARDRPYRPARSTATTLSLMADMVCDGHLDRGLFALLLTSDTWRRYGERFLAAGQIDEIDVAALLQRAEGA